MSKIVVGARLRRMRIEAGLQGKDLAARCKWQASKITRIEQGQYRASLDDLTLWVQECGADMAVVNDLYMMLARPAAIDPPETDTDEPIPHMIGISIGDHTMTRLLNYAVINGFTAEQAIIHLLGVAARQTP